jgi:hypothetical protein
MPVFRNPTMIRRPDMVIISNRMDSFNSIIGAVEMTLVA